MPDPELNPVLPADLRATIPQVGGNLCEKFNAKLANYIALRVQQYEWEYDSDGRFSCDYISQLCLLTCLGGTSETCPTVFFTSTVTPGNTTMEVVFNGAGMTLDWTYSIYRSTDPTSFTDPAVATGTTSGSSITFSDTGLTNGVRYYYKLVVQKLGCPEQQYPANGSGVTVSGTPSLCKSLLLQMRTFNDSSLAEGSISVKVFTIDGAGIPNASTWTIYRSTQSGEMGTQIATGAIGDAQADCTGQSGGAGLCYTDTGLGLCTRFFYTVIINESGGCPEYTLSANSYPAANPPSFGLAPTNVNGVFRATSVGALAGFRYSAYAVGNLLDGAIPALTGTMPVDPSGSTLLNFSFLFARPTQYPAGCPNSGSDGQQVSMLQAQSVWNIAITPLGCSGIIGGIQNGAIQSGCRTYGSSLLQGGAG